MALWWTHYGDGPRYQL